jgi:16S rRNA (cytosine1402-N4)-methyltransferase
MTAPHYSVLLPEILSYFQDVNLKIFVDGTLGAGGHSLALLNQFPHIEKLIGFDQDPDALEIAKNRLSNWESKTCFIKSNFVDMKKMLKEAKIGLVDGILLDLGVSSMQLDRPEKGFSFSKEGPLDMRMDPLASLTAEEIVNTWSEQELARIFRDYGEEKQWRHAARVIVRARGEKLLRTTKELADLLGPALWFKSKKGINPVTLIFQALRIAVNKELEVLEKILPDALSLLAPGGRLAIITFHSLEDRLVKNHFRFGASDKYDTSGIGGMFLDKKPDVKLITRKPVMATEVEVAENPRSRSAKLRVIEKLE